MMGEWPEDVFRLSLVLGMWSTSYSVPGTNLKLSVVGPWPNSVADAVSV